MTVGQLAVVVLVAVASLSSAPVAAEPLPIEIIHTGTDSVGERIVFHFKEAIRRSSSLTLSLLPTTGFRVRIISLDNSSTPGSGASSVFAATWTLYIPETKRDHYLNQFVGLCGTERVRECAEDLIVSTSKLAEEMQRSLKTPRKP